MKHVVCTLDELPDGAVRTMELRGRRICVFNVGGDYFAMASRCPHEGADLSHGKLVSLAQSPEPGTYERSRAREMLRCPWHGWEFDIRTGQSWCRPRTVRTRAYDVEVAEGCDLVKGPYVAETFAVEAKGRYLVVEV